MHFFTEFSNKEFLRLWKGLFYCMWMSDKPLVQEELAEELGSLVHCFPDNKVGLQFFRSFLDTMVIEWNKLDQWRMDKFMMVLYVIILYIFVQGLFHKDIINCLPIIGGVSDINFSINLRRNFK